MSSIYSINIYLHSDLNKETLTKILSRGLLLGFCYYDYVNGEIYEQAETLSADDAAHKILRLDSQLHWNDTNDVYVTFEETGFFISFKEIDKNSLIFRMSGWGNPRQVNGFIDFPYYIKQALDLCSDFIVLGLCTDVF